MGQSGEEIVSLSDEEVTALANDILTAPGTKVMLVALGGRIAVLPYQSK